MELTLSDGTSLIQFARKNLETYLATGSRLEISSDLATKYHEKSGAFVTLNRISKDQEHELRGCIGMILPYKPLIETIYDMSISAAVEDPRFPEVKLKELDNILIEISILSVPKKIIVSSSDEYQKKIVIGRDGLIVTRGYARGLLLPQVPIEHDRNWNVTTFLEHTCQKAGLSASAWQDIKNTTIENFTATIFEEVTPRGEIRQKRIGE
jgi:uncharacterized protein (TIGR00296 family)